jgi:tripartite-type tricarboxylate transporter receptor subunit TctC
MRYFFRYIVVLIISINLAYANTIELIVSSSPGGPNDIVTRKIGAELEKTNLKLLILNKPGAAHTIAYQYVYYSNKPTLILSTTEIENHKVYEILNEIFIVGNFKNLLFVSSKSNINNIDDIIFLSKRRQIKFGYGGVGSFSYAAMKTICEQNLNSNCLEVAYKGGAAGLLDVIRGEIDSYALVSYGSSQFINDDKLKVIYDIDIGKEKSWVKLFGKNISSEDKKTILNVLNNMDRKFFIDMGFKK